MSTATQPWLSKTATAEIDMTKFAGEHPLVSGFLVACAGDREGVIQEKVAMAVHLDATLADAFRAAFGDAFVKQALGLGDAWAGVKGLGSGLLEGAKNVGNLASGATNAAAGLIGSAATAPMRLGAQATDAVGLTNNAAGVTDAFSRPFNEAVVSGLKQTGQALGGPQVLSGRAAGGDELPVEQMRAAHQSWLSPGQQVGYNVANEGSDLASGMAAGGAAGKGLRSLGAVPGVSSAVGALGEVPGLARAGQATNLALSAGPPAYGFMHGVMSGPAQPGGAAEPAQPGGAAEPAQPGGAAEPAKQLGALGDDLAAGGGEGEAAQPGGDPAGGQPPATPAEAPVVGQPPAAPAEATGGVPGATGGVPGATPAGSPAPGTDEHLQAVASDPQATPEMKQQAAIGRVTSGLESKQISPQAAAKLATDPNAWQADPQANQAAQANLAKNMAAQDPAAGNQPGFMDQVMQAYEGLGPGERLLLLGGLGIGAIGLISGLAGDGGIGSWLLTALGLGGAAVGAGAGGMFGQQAQGMIQGGINQLAPLAGVTSPYATQSKPLLHEAVQGQTNVNGNMPQATAAPEQAGQAAPAAPGQQPAAAQSLPQPATEAMADGVVTPQEFKGLIGDPGTRQQLLAMPAEQSLPLLRNAVQSDPQGLGKQITAMKGNPRGAMSVLTTPVGKKYLWHDGMGLTPQEANTFLKLVQQL